MLRFKYTDGGLYKANRVSKFHDSFKKGQKGYN